MKVFDVVNRANIGNLIVASSKERALEIAVIRKNIRKVENAKSCEDVTEENLKSSYAHHESTGKSLQEILDDGVEGCIYWHAFSLTASQRLAGAVNKIPPEWELRPLKK